MTPVSGRTSSARSREAALGVLCSEDLSSMVELVCWSPETDVYEARAVDGWVRFRRHSQGARPTFTTESFSERNPLAEQDPARFSPLADELAHPTPQRTLNSYPHAYEHIAQVFDHPCAPDLCVLHTAAHRTDGHRGEHGSLGVIQARAPVVASGAGVIHEGIVDGHCRLVDIAPTILRLLDSPHTTGVGPTGAEREGLYLSRQDGDAVEMLCDPSSGAPVAVIAFLLDRSIALPTLADEGH